MNVFYIIDLILVCFWALFALCNTMSGSILLFPVILIRLSTVFCLQQRERKAWLPILVFVLVALAAMSLRSYDFNDFILRPFARMYDYIIMLVAGHSILLEGAYHFLGNHGDLVPEPGLSWYIFVGCYMAWLVLAPIIIFSSLLLTKRLIKSHWNWRKIIIASILYIFLSGIILAIYEFDPTVLPGAGRTWWLAVVSIPLIVNIRWHSLSLFCRRYIIVTSLFVIAIIAGIYMQSMGSLIAIVVSVPMFYYLIGYEWGDRQTPRVFQNLSILILSGVTFWTAQYGIGISKVVLFTISIWLVALVSGRMWRKSRCIIPSSVIFLVCAIILPSIALGYNPFSCIGASRLCNFDDYDYSYRGLLKVRNKHGVAIRDRFGYITPTDIDKIEPMGDSTKPYVKLNVDNGWGIYDLERQEYTLEPDSLISNILPYDENVWKLMDKDGNGYSYDKFFVGPRFYYRYKKRGFESECPYENRLAEYLPLRYDYRVRDAEGLDYLLSELMKPLWKKPDTISTADFYWNWAKDVTSTIERLHDYHNMFYVYDGLYNYTMNDLEEYIEPSLASGMRAEMDAGSYVIATIENYRMMKAVLELADSLPNMNIRQEYELFNEFMSSFENWRAVYDDRNGRYGDWTLVQNSNATSRFKGRRKSVEDIISVIKGDTIIPTTPQYYFVNKAFDKLERSYDSAKELVAPVRENFKKWIDYRDEIASQLPQHMAASYRYQTRQLEKFYTTDEFLYGDEL